MERFKNKNDYRSKKIKINKDIKTEIVGQRILRIKTRAKKSKKRSNKRQKQDRAFLHGKEKLQIVN